MAIPPHVRCLLPTPNIDGGQTGHMKVTLTMAELRVLIIAVISIEVDQQWYLRQYPDVHDGIAHGTPQPAAQHYRTHGFLEGRLPADPLVDEEWYRATNPDVAVGIRDGTWRNANEHYIRCGYSEGRATSPPTNAPLARPVAPAAARFSARPRI